MTSSEAGSNDGWNGMNDATVNGEGDILSSLVFDNTGAQPNAKKPGMAAYGGHTIELPPHLQYKEVKVRKLYQGVEARHLKHLEPGAKADWEDKMQRVQKQWQKVPQLTPKNPKYAGVSSKFAEPRQEQVRPKAEERMTKEQEQHIMLAKRLGFGSVTSKFMEKDPALELVESPRHAVEAKRQSRMVELKWRNPTGIPLKFQSFDELRQRNRKLLESHDVKLKKPKVESVVNEYVRSGTPLKHTSMIGREKFVPPSRPQSAPRHPRKWSPGGGAGMGYKEVRNNSPIRKAFTLEEQVVKQSREDRKTATTPKNSVFRVASFQYSPSLRLAPSESDILSGVFSHTDPISGLVSPSASILSPNGVERGRSPTSRSPNRRVVGTIPDEDGAVETVVGPVTLAVPAGAVVSLRKSSATRPPAISTTH